MNIFFKIRGELVTPKLTGSILPGITRDSIIKFARDVFGITVREERIAIAEIFEENESGGLEEVFGTGDRNRGQPGRWNDMGRQEH